jgi:CRISPR-associated protein Cst1
MNSVDTRLRWTGHPLVDVGVAALTALAGRDTPDEVTPADLERFAELAERAFVDDPGTSSLLTVLFTVNFPATQPSFSPQRRRDEAAALLRLFLAAPQPGLPPCAFCGRPAVVRGARDLVPMLSGRGTPNFFPSGRAGLPICGACATALQAVVFGAPRCEGRALVVAAGDPRLTLRLVGAWTKRAVERAQLAVVAGDTRGWRYPRTRVLQHLLELLPAPAEEDELTPLDGEQTGAVVVYHLTNSGQGPDIDIYVLPAVALRFAQRARAAGTRATWDAMVDRAWQERRRRDGNGRGGSTRATPETDPVGSEQRRNALYEDLFALPEAAGRFVRRHVLGLARRGAEAQDVTALQHLRLWRIAHIFLEEVVGMDQRRIEAIRQLGDRIAAAICDGDRRLFSSLRRVSGYRDVRGLLLRAGTRYLQEHDELLLSFDDFLLIFEEGEEVPRVDWRLAWDLVFLRVLEQLHERGWFRQHVEALAEIVQAETEAEAESVEVGEGALAAPLPA